MFSLMCESIIDQTYRFVRHNIFLFFYVHFKTLWRDTQTTMHSANTNLKTSISSKHTNTQAHTRTRNLYCGDLCNISRWMSEERFVRLNSPTQTYKTGSLCTLACCLASRLNHGSKSPRSHLLFSQIYNQRVSNQPAIITALNLYSLLKAMFD